MNPQPAAHAHAPAQRVNPATNTKFDLFDCRCGITLTSAEIASFAKAAGVDATTAADPKAEPFLRLVGRTVGLRTLSGGASEGRLLDANARGIVIEDGNVAVYTPWASIAELSWPMTTKGV